MVRCGYCGNGPIPPGYDYRKTQYQCLKSGIGVGIHQERRKWQRQMGFRVDPEYISPCPRAGAISRNNERRRSPARRSQRRVQRRRSPQRRIQRSPQRRTQRRRSQRRKNSRRNKRLNQ